MHKIGLVIFFVIIVEQVFSQRRIFLPSQVIDSTYGVEFYEKYNAYMGNDSVRQHEGYAVRGLITDKYANGQTLHKGYYLDGQLRTYTNYYPSGKMERQFKALSDVEYKLTKYYENSIIKSEVIVEKKSVVSWIDNYENGNLELEEIYFGGTNLLKSRKTGYENGNMESELISINKKKNLYWEKNYHSNGKIANEGEKRYDENLLGYLKTGKWKVYNENGELIKEERYINDILQDGE